MSTEFENEQKEFIEEQKLKNDKELVPEEPVALDDESLANMDSIKDMADGMATIIKSCIDDIESREVALLFLTRCIQRCNYGIKIDQLKRQGEKSANSDT